MPIDAGCHEVEPRGDTREPTHRAWQQELGCAYIERCGAQHFNPKMESPVSFELTIDAANLASDARQVLDYRQPHDPHSPFPEASPEDKKRVFQMTAESFQHMKETISNSSPQDVSTMLTLANKLLDRSGIQFVYNDQGMVDLQSSDGHIAILARPKR